METIIELLVKNFPEKLEHLCMAIDEMITYPIIYVEGQVEENKQSEISIDIVKMMVKAYPQALVTPDEDWACYPIHVDLFNEYCGLEVIEYLLEYMSEPSSIRLLDAYGRSPFHSSCRYRCGVNHLEVVQLLFAKWPEAIQQRDTWNNWLPIHDISYDSGDLCEDMVKTLL